jgi:hypothetical protein
MDDKNFAELDENLADVTGEQSGPCSRCHMMVARYAPQVLSSGGVYHRECFEAWYFGRHGKRPALLGGSNGDRHRFRVREGRERDRAA